MDDEFEEIRIDANNVIRKRKPKPSKGETNYHPESETQETFEAEIVDPEKVVMSHEETKSTEEHSMYTNPALPVTVGASDFHDRRNGFEPADAALVQSNNLATLAAQIANSNQMNVQFMAQQSKENALLTSAMLGHMSKLESAITATSNGGGEKLIDNLILLSIVNRLFPPTPPAA